jgi:hypothetical protein
MQNDAELSEELIALSYVIVGENEFIARFRPLFRT